MHLDFKIPVVLCKRFDEYLARFPMLTKTDVVTMSLEYVMMSKDEREARMRSAAIELEAVRKERDQLSEEVSRLTALLESYSAKPELVQMRSIRAEQMMKSTRELLRTGELTPNALAFRADLLRPFIKDRTIPEEQKVEIAEFISEIQGAKS